MKIWILKEGVKDGPLHDFEVRTRISEGLIKPGMIAWHQGLDEWQKIEDIPLFKDAFTLDEASDRATVTEEDLADFPAGINSGVTVTVEEPYEEEDESQFKDEKFTPEGEYVPTLKDGTVNTYPFRRLAARLIDMILFFSSVFLFITLFYKQNPLIFMQGEKPALFIVLLFFLYEFGFSFTWGTTLGKSLMGLRVESLSGKNLSLLPALIRTLLALCITFFSLSSLMLLIINGALVFIYFKLKKTSPWDIIARSQTRGLPLTKSRIIGVFCLLICINMMTSFFTPAEYHEQNKEYFEKTFKEIQAKAQSASDKK